MSSGAETLHVSLDAKTTSKSELPRFVLSRRVYKGVEMLENEVEQIEVMGTRTDDIWVCSHPRSGTTLTQELSFLIETLDFEKAQSVYLDDRFPMIDILDDRFPFYRGVKFIEEMSSPRFIKSHLPYFLLPEQLRQGKGRDLAGHVRKIAAFLNKKLSDDDVDRICKHCHVDRMRTDDKVNMSYWRNIKQINDDADGGFINKGKAGVWKDLLTPDIVEKIDVMLKELDGTGLVLREH
ncbi:uncharacterized protein LOC128220901 [Mya arenaria]|uniref:uncharacterized protein LOC128220901 n=1 Tax=Mya arenaria TaxID=6604 RepID=UPI0022E45370|nr:uncharacterized protein LOC128220901 [Mya arenaria]